MLVRIGTRRSPLALWQARCVGDRLAGQHGDIEIEFVEIVTEGDRRLDTELSRIGGKGLFLKEIELALLDDRIDVAVHSLKDVTVEVTGGLTLAAYLERGNPRDALVSTVADIGDLPPGAVVGTSSSRRRCMLRRLRPDLDITGVRGNVGTRLAKLDEGRYDALLLAAAGLERLDLGHRISAELAEDIFVPAVGQGIVVAQVREDDDAVTAAVAALDHSPTRCRALAERAVNRALGGGCHLPIAAHACIEGAQLTINALVGDEATGRCISAARQGAADHPEELGELVANVLLDAGAKGMIDKARA